MSAVTVSESVSLAVAPGEVWPFLSETDRINRWLGLPPVSARPVTDGAHSAARFIIDTKSAGLSTSYEEFPFEWISEREFKVFRKMIGGPFESLSVGFKLEPIKGGGKPATDATTEPGDGTRVNVELSVVPRSPLARPLAWLVLRRNARKMLKLAEDVEAHVKNGAPSPFLRPASTPDKNALRRGLEALEKSGVEPDVVKHIGEILGAGSDADCVRIRPFELADQWGLPRIGVLKAFLHAVPAGLTELRWGVICPSCRTASQQHLSLSEIGDDGHCQLCDISFGIELDRAVEATFVPHPSVRIVPEQMFCIGGPARTPHVYQQANVPAGATKSLDVPGASGRYRVFARGGALVGLEVAPDAPPSTSVKLDADHGTPREARVAPGGHVEVENASSEERHVKLERFGYASNAATAHIVATLPDFRRLFSSDLLKAGTPLKVSRVAILFSDLTGSTALYTHVGDAAAFRLVDDHFDVIRKAIARHDGTVVKTMGDAVLAAFVDETSCARAAIEALKEFEIFRRGREHGEHTGLKLGMYGGACYVVSANGLLDYFGQTVNVASRVQHLAESGELVLTAETYDELGAAELGAMRVVERFDAQVKGVTEPLRLVRLRLQGTLAPVEIKAPLAQ
jgi:adenylate cyclase